MEEVVKINLEHTKEFKSINEEIEKTKELLNKRKRFNV